VFSRVKARVNHGRPTASAGPIMQDKAKIIFSVLATAVIVFFVSAVVTFANIGFRVDFVQRWLRAFIIGWPVASVLGYFALPLVRRLTERIVALIDGERI
jgi:hypothetical protein